jgi:hypothetical protein
VGPGGYLLFQREFSESRNGFDQIAVRSAGANLLASSDPTSMLSGFRCSRSEASASSATLLRVRYALVCCVHQLNPQSKADSSDSSERHGCCSLCSTGAAMDEKSLRQVQASIATKKVSILEDEARELARRALQFKNERGRLP